ncbi:unnamed protein product [Caretta caretta]
MRCVGHSNGKGEDVVSRILNLLQPNQTLCIKDPAAPIAGGKFLRLSSQPPKLISHMPEVMWPQCPLSDADASLGFGNKDDTICCRAQCFVNYKSDSVRYPSQHCLAQELPALSTPALRSSAGASGKRELQSSEHASNRASAVKVTQARFPLKNYIYEITGSPFS